MHRSRPFDARKSYSICHKNSPKALEINQNLTMDMTLAVAR
jgi:hypothetical protein